MKQFRIRKDDKVMVIAGKDQGKIGKVLKVLHKHDSVVVEKVNVAKRREAQPLSARARRDRG